MRVDLKILLFKFKVQLATVLLNLAFFVLLTLSIKDMALQCELDIKETSVYIYLVNEQYLVNVMYVTLLNRTAITAESVSTLPVS